MAAAIAILFVQVGVFGVCLVRTHLAARELRGICNLLCERIAALESSAKARVEDINALRRQLSSMRPTFRPVYPPQRRAIGCKSGRCGVRAQQPVIEWD